MIRESTVIKRSGHPDQVIRLLSHSFSRKWEDHLIISFSLRSLRKSFAWGVIVKECVSEDDAGQLNQSKRVGHETDYLESRSASPSPFPYKLRSSFPFDSHKYTHIPSSLSSWKRYCLSYCRLPFNVFSSTSNRHSRGWRNKDLIIWEEQRER